MTTVPWPAIHALDALAKTTKSKVPVPLQERYTMEDMWYLDTEHARPMFEQQADIIIHHGYTGIVDVGCRHGPVNQILHDKGYTDYNYFGFDTSKDPISVGKSTWQDLPNINYEVMSWNDDYQVEFTVDVMIFSGVLLYIKDDIKRQDLFLEMMSRNNCVNAIIQEPFHSQQHWDDRLILNTITDGGLDWLQQDFNVVEYHMDLPVFAGRRVVYDVTTKP